MKKLLILTLLFSMNTQCGFFELFNPENIRIEAAANIARQKAAEEAAKLQAESERITKERAEALVALLQGCGYICFNTGRFMKELITSPRGRIAEHLRNGKPEVVTGLIGTIGLTVAAYVAWNNYKKAKRARADRNEPVYYQPYMPLANAPVDLPPAYDGD